MVSAEPPGGDDPGPWVAGFRPDPSTPPPPPGLQKKLGPLSLLKRESVHNAIHLCLPRADIFLCLSPGVSWPVGEIERKQLKGAEIPDLDTRMCGGGTETRPPPGIDSASRYGERMSCAHGIPDHPPKA